MSKYRVEIDISFANEQDAVNFLNDIEKVKSKTYKPNGTEKIQCFQGCRYHKCSHDDAVPVQCGDYVNIEFDKPEKIHKKKGDV